MNIKFRRAIFSSDDQSFVNFCYMEVLTVGANWPRIHNGYYHKPDTDMLLCPVRDASGKELYDQDIIRDRFHNLTYTLHYGWCKKHAYTGWYVEDVDGRQRQINADNDSDRALDVELIGNVHEKGTSTK